MEYKGKQKTKSLKVNEKLQAIIDLYAGQSAFYLFPVLSASPLPVDCTVNEKYRYDKHIESKTSIINKDLKVISAACGINKTISTHVARHSFAYISHKNGVETRLIQNMLGHTTFQMTETYIKSLIVDDELDSAADMIY